MSSLATLRHDDHQHPHRRRQGRPDFLARLETMKQLVEFRSEDQDRIAAAAPLVAGHASAITAAFYQSLLAHPETAQSFTGDDGRVDHTKMSARADALQRWLRLVVGAPLDRQAAEHAAHVGLVHLRGGEDTAHPAIKGRYLAAGASLLFAAIADVLVEAVDDPCTLAATLVAWHKLLTLYVDIFLAVQASGSRSPNWY
jgi:hemoglobin-like flavoprotein